uniref:Uncharacterized protein n=1 Tax=Panagrolaimus sp. PS1159 TaxID=55785 RepID=A0AC35FLS3_9BILA
MNFFMKKNDTKPSQKSSIQLSKNFPDIKKKALKTTKKFIYTLVFFHHIFCVKCVSLFSLFFFIFFIL